MEKSSKISIFHGSFYVKKEVEFDNIFVNFDFGKGLYASFDEEVGKQIFSRFKSNSFFYHYSLETDGLKVLNFYDKKYSLLNFVATLTKYRIINFLRTYNIESVHYLIDNFAIDIEPYDIIIYPRTENSNFDFILSFVRNGMSYQTMKKFLDLSEEAKCIAIIKEDVLKMVELNKIEYLDCKAPYERYVRNDLKMRNKLKIASKRGLPEKNALFIDDIMKGGIKNNDSRL